MCGNPKLLEQFMEANKLLESVQKGLADYLETKRLAFARFFFLSNDELLQVGSPVFWSKVYSSKMEHLFRKVIG